MSREPKPFIVVRGAKLPARERRGGEPPIVADKANAQRAEQKQRERRIKSIAADAFRNWRPGG
jgi:hypothetical protein